MKYDIYTLKYCRL